MSQTLRSFTLSNFSKLKQKRVRSRWICVKVRMKARVRCPTQENFRYLITNLRRLLSKEVRLNIEPHPSVDSLKSRKIKVKSSLDIYNVFEGEFVFIFVCSELKLFSARFFEGKKIDLRRIQILSEKSHKSLDWCNG